MAPRSFMCFALSLLAAGSAATPLFVAARPRGPEPRPESAGPQVDTNELFLEITRYLAAVDLYRDERCEPTWLPESAPSPAFDEPLQIRAGTRRRSSAP